MFDAIKNMAEQALSGDGDSSSLAQAVGDHVNSTDPGALSDHLQGAASSLQQNGQDDLAQQVSGLVTQIESDPAGAKDAVVSFVTNNPSVLEHFAPEFAQGIASRLGL